MTFDTGLHYGDTYMYNIYVITYHLTKSGPDLRVSGNILCAVQLTTHSRLCMYDSFTLLARYVW